MPFVDHHLPLQMEKKLGELLIRYTYQHAQLAGKLPPTHKDPFDRMLVAQVMIEKLTIVTRDRLIEQYEVSVLKA